MVIVLPDIAGDGQTHQLAALTDPRRASWIQFIVTGFAATPARVGDLNTSATQGFPIPGGGGMFYPWREMPKHELYRLCDVWYNVPVGMTLTIGFAQN